MLMNLQGKWLLRLATLLLWALACASAVYWALQWVSTPPAPAAAQSAGSGRVAIDTPAIALLMGGVAASPVAQPVVSAASRFVLLGVLAGHAGGGAALIAVDGKPPKPYRVGAALEPGLVLVSLKGRQAELGPQAGAPASLTLQLPVLPAVKK